MHAYRIFALNQSATHGQHFTLVATGHTLKAALAELRRRDAVNSRYFSPSRFLTVSRHNGPSQPLITI